MPNLYKNMRRGGSSYGTVPGNGNPKADDIVMNVGEGHIVPAENTHIAKKLVKRLGYDPKAKAVSTSGGTPIRISSGEFVLNKEQVEGIKGMGIDPEILSPNSPYNQRVKDGGSTKKTEKMVNQSLNMYNLMMNNNNQYPSYQNGGKKVGWETVPKYAIPEYRLPVLDTGYQASTQPPAGWETAPEQNIDPTYIDYGRGNDPEPRTENTALQIFENAGLGTNNLFKNMSGLNIPQNAGQNFVQYTNQTSPNPAPRQTQNTGTRNTPVTQRELTQETVPVDPTKTTPSTDINPVQQKLIKEVYGKNSSEEDLLALYEDKDVRNWAAKEEKRVLDGTSVFKNLFPPDALEIINPEESEVEVIPESFEDIYETTLPYPKSDAKDPYDKSLDDLYDDSKALTRNEQLANAIMGIHNLGRGYQGIGPDKPAISSTIRRDYEGERSLAYNQIDKDAALARYQAMQMGVDPSRILPAIQANVTDAKSKVNASIRDMRAQDTKYNVGTENQFALSNKAAADRMDLYDFMARQQFDRAKGASVSKNIENITEAEKDDFFRNAPLRMVQANQDLTSMKDDYEKLDRNKMQEAGKILLFKQYKDLSEEEKLQWHDMFGKGDDSQFS